MRLLCALLCVLAASALLLAGAWLIYPPAAVIVGGVLLGYLAYGLLTAEERARL